MPLILPISDLEDTNHISSLCKETNQPIFLTKDGYGDMVIMSLNHYEKALAKLEMYAKLEVAEMDIEEGRVRPAVEAVAETRARYGL